MHKFYPTQHSTTDGFIRNPPRVTRKPFHAKAVRKQPILRISDTVINPASSNENQARLVFYSKLSQQSYSSRSKNYSLTEAPVARDLSIKLFADEIETRIKNGPHKSDSDTHGNPAVLATSKRPEGMMRKLGRVMRLH